MRDRLSKAAGVGMLFGIVFLSGGMLCGQVPVEPPEGAGPPTTPVTGAMDDAEARTPEAIESGRAMFERAVAAYRAAPVIGEQVTIRVTTKFMDDVSERESQIGITAAADAARVELDDVTIVAVDGTLYGEWAGKPERYYAEDFKGGISPGLFGSFMPMIPPVLTLRFSQEPLNDLSMYTIGAKIGGSRQGVDEGGEAYEEILVDSAGDEAGAGFVLRLDPKTHFVRRFEIMLRDPGAPKDDGTRLVMTMEPVVMEEVGPEAFFVRTEGREEVTSFGGLFAPPDTEDLVGEAAPSIDLVNLEGETLKLDDLMGQVVVIVFWSIATEDMHATLGVSQTTADWIATKSAAAKMIVVNSGDSLEDVKTFWSGKTYSMPLWLDPDMSAAKAYLAPLLPITVVIAADGTVTDVKMGFDMNSDEVQWLKDAVTKALAYGL